MKKVKNTLILLLMCILLLCGCSKKDGRTTVQFASWGSKSEVEIIKPLISEFEKENPDIKIDFMHIPQNYFQKIHLLFASNTSPDVIFINNLYLPLYADFLEELSVDKDVYYKQTLDNMTNKGRLLAVPRDVSNLVIYYNADMFDEKHVPYPDANWTFDDFLKTAQKFSGNGTFGISFEEDPYYYLPYLMSMGGGILPDEMKKQESLEALQFYADLRKKYHVAPKRSESASATMAQMFLQKRLAMYLSGRWLVPKFKEECKFHWDVAPFPKGKKGSIVQADSSGWAISKYSKNKAEAKKFVDFMSSKKSSEKFMKSGLIVPARRDVKLDDGGLPKHSKVFIDVIETSKPTPVTKDYREIINNLKKDMEAEFN